MLTSRCTGFCSHLVSVDQFTIVTTRNIYSLNYIISRLERIIIVMWNKVVNVFSQPVSSDNTQTTCNSNQENGIRCHWIVIWTKVFTTKVKIEQVKSCFGECFTFLYYVVFVYLTTCFSSFHRRRIHQKLKKRIALSLKLRLDRHLQKSSSSWILRVFQGGVLTSSCFIQ